MSDAVAHLSPAQALRMVAAAPGGKAKTAATLRHEAGLFSQDAERLIAAPSPAAHAAKLAKYRKAAEQRADAKVSLLAATEVERRKAQTVGEALRNPVSRLLRSLGAGRG